MEEAVVVIGMVEGIEVVAIIEVVLEVGSVEVARAVLEMEVNKELILVLIKIFTITFYIPIKEEIDSTATETRAINESLIKQVLVQYQLERKLSLKIKAC